jgi:hypothetical protein
MFNLYELKLPTYSEWKKSVQKVSDASRHRDFFSF